jgi:hypothetical protein
LGTGLANTNAIIALYGKENNAARLCYDLSLNGYTDWYLPSKDELNKLYLSRNVIGGFTAFGYWSSSEYNAANTWDQILGDGGQGYGGKNNTEYVRCVRSF